MKPTASLLSCSMNCIQPSLKIRQLKLWQIVCRNDWPSVRRGLEKCHSRLMLTVALVVSPEQPWLAVNMALVSTAAIVMTYFVAIGAVSLLFARSDLLAFVEMAHAFTFVTALWLLILTHYTLKIPILYKILQMIDEGIFEYDTQLNRQEIQLVRHTAQLYHKLFKRGYRIALLTIFVILACVAPILTSIYGKEERKKIQQINYNLPFPCWFPYKLDTILKYTLTYILVLIQIGFVFFYLAAAMPFLFYGVMEVSTQCKILEISIRNLEERALEKYHKTQEQQPPDLGYHLRQYESSSSRYDRCVEEALKENIRHHAEILRFFNLYQNLTSTIYGVIIGVSMMILASLSLVLSKTKLFSFETVKFAVFFSVELVVVFGYCLLGTFITEVSREIPRALYDYPWFNAHAKNKKILRTFQFFSGESIVLRGNGIFVIDLQLFVQIVQTTYSIFNIFSSMEK